MGCRGYPKLSVDKYTRRIIFYTWSDGSSTSTDNFGVQLRSLVDDATDTAIYALSGNMVRAAWNYLLLHADGSEGVHNPGFTNWVITATMRQDLSL